MVQSRRAGLTRGAQFLFLAVPVLAGAGYSRHTWGKPQGRYSPGEILEQGARLCRRIAPETADARISVRPNRDPSSDHYWEVSCNDSSRSQVGTVTWNADTGDLVSMGHSAAPIQGNLIRSRKTAERVAAQWLRDLELSQPGSNWKVVSVTHRPDRPWWVCLRSGTQDVTVAAEPTAGSLACLQIHKIAGSSQLARDPGCSQLSGPCG